MFHLPTFKYLGKVVGNSLENMKQLKHQLIKLKAIYFGVI